MYKRDAGNVILNTLKKKLLLLVYLHPSDRQGSPSCHNFLIVNPSYHSKVNLVGLLEAEKSGDVVSLYVFIIAFPASLL